jgi:hypothetical protein
MSRLKPRDKVSRQVRASSAGLLGTLCLRISDIGAIKTIEEVEK